MRSAERSTTRSPAAASTGRSSRSSASPVPASSGSSSRTHLAGTSAVPRKACRRRPERGGPPSGSQVSATPRRSAGVHGSAARTRHDPRGASPRSTPGRATATRPPSARSTGASWTSRPRTRATAPDGWTATRSSRASAPPQSVPVTTVPAPGTAKARSTNSRGGPARSRGRSAAARRSRAAAEVGEALAARRADGDDLHARADERGHLGRRGGRVGEVRARDGHHAGSDAQQAQHRQVLARLGHDAVVGGDAQQVAVDAGRAGDHVAHEALVAGDVHQAQPPPRGQRQRREAQLDRDAACLLGLEVVGVAAGQRQHQGRLAVVHVPGRAEDQRLVRRGAHRVTLARGQAAAFSSSPRRSRARTASSSGLWPRSRRRSTCSRSVAMVRPSRKWSITRGSM